jgi:hypothetical protein
VLVFGALNTSEVYVVDGDSTLWFGSYPFGPSDWQIVDTTVNGCFPVYSESLFRRRLG